MSLKRKTPPPNSLSYWWNEFLFARSFSYTTSLSQYECEKALHEIAHSVEGGWFASNPVSKTVSIQPDHDISGAARFDIRLKRRNRGIHYTMAKAEGTIAHDDETGETIVQGRTKFGALQYGLVLIYVAGFLIFFLGSGFFFSAMPVWFILVMLFVLGFTWWRLYTDRNYLTNLIGSTLREAELTPPEAGKRKHGDEDAVIGSLMDMDESAGQRWKRR